MSGTQVSPYTNPANSSITFDGAFNGINITLTNNDTVTASGKNFSNMGSFINNGTINNTSGSWYNEGSNGKFTNNGTINNSATFAMMPDTIFENNGSVVNNKSAELDFDAGGNNNALITNYGLISQYGGTNTANGIITLMAGSTFKMFAQHQYINEGLIKGSGTIDPSTSIVNKNGGRIEPGNSAGGLYVLGDLYHQDGGIKHIEIGGPDGPCGPDADRDSNKSHDFIDITGDLIIDGAYLEASLIDGFKLSGNQNFLITKLDGELTGQYEDLGEGDSLGKFESIYGTDIDLFVTYEGGDGDDIGLYTKPQTLGELVWTVLGYDM